MKKLRLILVALLFAGWGTVQAQQPQQRNTQMRGYFQQTVLPFVEKQQAKLVQALTPAEKQELQKIREEMITFRKQGAQMRKAMQGHFNQQAWDARKARFEAIVAKARKLTEAHPQAAAAYKKAVEDELAKWREQMPARAGGRMGAQGGHNMMGKNPHAKMNKLSDPAFGLLLDARAMQSMMHHQGMKGNGGMKGREMGNRGKPAYKPMERPEGFAHAVMMAMRKPEVQKKIKAYREKNILPVIEKQRKVFDNVLSKKEKKEIAEARANMKTLRDQHRQMRTGGERLSDSARLAMQQQLDKDRIAIRGIVLKHYSELQKALAPIREKMPQWRKDIRKIVAEYVVEQQMNRMGKAVNSKIQPLMKEKGEMMFLLMDPANPDNNGLFLFPGSGKK